MYIKNGAKFFERFDLQFSLEDCENSWIEADCNRKKSDNRSNL